MTEDIKLALISSGICALIHRKPAAWLKNPSAIRINIALPERLSWAFGAKIKKNKALSEETQHEVVDDFYHHL